MKEKYLCWHTALPFDFIQIKHAQDFFFYNPVHECGSQLQAPQAIYIAKIRIKLIHKRVGKKNYQIRFSDFSEKNSKTSPRKKF